MLLGGVAGIGQVLEMIPDLILLTLTLILIPVAFSLRIKFVMERN